jgi:hypothetical protein
MAIAIDVFPQHFFTHPPHPRRPKRAGRLSPIAANATVSPIGPLGGQNHVVTSYTSATPNSRIPAVPFLNSTRNSTRNRCALHLHWVFGGRRIAWMC